MTDADTLRMLEDAARVAVPFDAARIRAWREGSGRVDRNRWRSMAEQGWFSIAVSEEDGGLGLELDAACAVARVLGAAAAPEPFVAAGVVVPKLLTLCPPSPRRDAALAAVISGEALVAVAHLDPSGSPPMGASGVVARADADMLSLNGMLRFVPVPDADAFLVPVDIDQVRFGEAAAPYEAKLLWVDANTDGLTVEREPTADGGALGLMTFNDVAVPASNQLAGGGFQYFFDEAHDYGIMANCAELQGNLERALELTVDFLKTRSQFGKTIGSFQVLQHRTVDLWMHAKVADHALTAALTRVMAPDVPPDARAEAASGAKARVARTALDLGNDAIQLHGAIGFTDEYDLALYVNRAIAIAPYLGNADDHLKRYGELKQRRGEALEVAA